jgi:hypothetical protein
MEDPGKLSMNEVREKNGSEYNTDRKQFQHELFSPQNIPSNYQEYQTLQEW